MPSQDARAERRLAAAAAARLEGRMSIPVEPHDDRRQPFDWTFCCGSVSWAYYFEPSPRDVRQRRVFRDGRP